MKETHREGNNSGETTAEPQGLGKCSGFEKVKNMIADKIHEAAKSIYEIATDSDASSCKAQYVNHASEWLDQAAEAVRRFECEQADAGVRKCVGRSPGASLLIAGGVGLIIGVFLRRR